MSALKDNKKEIPPGFPQERKQPKTVRFDGKFIFTAAVIIVICCLVAGIGGYQLGYRSIYGDGYQNGYDKGNDKGYNEGLEQGKSDGYDLGYEEGTAAAQAVAATAPLGEDTDNDVIPVSDGESVYCTAAGSCYHFPGCSYIEGKTNLIEMTEAEAIEEGYGACSRCGKE